MTPTKYRKFLMFPAEIHTEERKTFARQILKALAGFGVVEAIIDYLNGRYLTSAEDSVIVLSCFLVLWLGRNPRHTKLPLEFAISVLLTMNLTGTFQIMPQHLANSVWAPIFPFLYFYLTGPRIGLWLASLCLLVMPLGYEIFPLFSDAPRIEPYALFQVMGAFMMASLLAYRYEQIRSGQENQLRHFSECDPLTGLLNRRGFTDQSVNVIQHALRSQESFAVVLLDVDDFKRVNDTEGHEAGDRLLREIASLLQQHTRNTDLIARWGGEEFILLLAHSDMEGGRAVAEKICSAISGHAFTTGKHTASFGLAFHEQDEPLETTINRADLAMYQAKQKGKNRVEVLLLQPA